MLANPTGEALAQYDSWVVDINFLLTKTFHCTESIATATESVYWNGLSQSNHYYLVQNNSIIFNTDIPLQIGDEIGVKYFIGD